jgi:hypothetical protein
VPIVFDATSKITGSGVATISGNHTIGAGSNRILIVGVVYRNTTFPTLQSVHYNGGNGHYLGHEFSGQLHVQLHCFLEADLPAAGTYTLQVTIDKVCDGGIMLLSASYFGVAQQVPTDLRVKTGTSASPSFVWNSATQAGDRIIYIGGCQQAQTPTATGTNAALLNNGNVGTIGGILARDTPVNAGDNETYGYSYATSDLYTMLSAEFLIAATSVTLTGQRSTGTPGTLAKAESLSLTGKRATGTPGTLAKAESLSLTGKRATGAQGTLAGAGEGSLTGKRATGTPGTITGAVEVILTGKKILLSTGFLQGIINVINLPHNLILDYDDVDDSYLARISMDGTIYGLYLIEPTEDRAGCVRIIAGGDVYAIAQAGGNDEHEMLKSIQQQKLLMRNQKTPGQQIKP